MKKNKECILVVGYTPTKQKEEALKNLLLKLQERSTPIFLVLHNQPSKSILDLVDYFLYDKENITLTNFKDTHAKSINYLSEDFNIFTAYNVGGQNNHGAAAIKMMLLGLYNLKGLGFEKCQLIEYDTFLPDFKEIDNNFKILDEYDAVAYNGFDHLGREGVILLQFHAYNLSKFQFDELILTTEDLKKEFKKYPKYSGMAEGHYYEYLLSHKNTYFKHPKVLDEGGIKVDISQHEDFNDHRPTFDAAPFWDRKSKSVLIFVSTLKQYETLFEIKVNGINFTKKLPKGRWEIFSPEIPLEEIKTIEFVVNKTYTINFDFENDITPGLFKENSRTVQFNKDGTYI